MEPEVLKSKGNEAFQKCKFHDALQYYTEGIRACHRISYCHLEFQKTCFVHICCYGGWR
jgi:hypothetical protein